MQVVCRIGVGVVVRAVLVGVDQPQRGGESLHGGQDAHARRVAKGKDQQEVDFLFAEKLTRLAGLVGRVDQFGSDHFAKLFQVFHQARVHVDATVPESGKLFPVIKMTGG